jgi:hypothetical protein
MGVTAILLIMCIVGVNLFFRHTLTIMWFSCKLLISVMVYFQVRDVIHTSIGTDPLGIQSALFGSNIATVEMSMSILNDLIKSKIFSLVDFVCPICMPHTPEPIVEIELSPWVHWIGNTLFI